MNTTQSVVAPPTHCIASNSQYDWNWNDDDRCPIVRFPQRQADAQEPYHPVTYYIKQYYDEVKEAMYASSDDEMSQSRQYEWDTASVEHFTDSDIETSVKDLESFESEEEVNSDSNNKNEAIVESEVYKGFCYC